jgi:hypothetical protein
VWVELAFQVTEECDFLWQAVAVSAVSIVLDVVEIAMYFPNTGSEYRGNCFVTVSFVLV